MPTQSHRLVAISTPLAEDELLFYKAEFVEELGRAFCYSVELLSENDSILLEDLLGQNVTIRLETADSTRYFNGFVTEFQQVGTEHGLSHYKAVVRPWLWLLSLSENCRIFQEKSYPDIVKEVFDELGFSDYELRLTNTYSPVEYVVQFNESDFNFVSRLLEQEGIFYYFEHINGKHTLVLADQNSSMDELGDVSYFPPDEVQNLINEEVITHWQNHKKVRTSGVRLIDYDFEVPSKNLEAVSSVPTTTSLAAIEKFNYPGNYKERANGTNYTRLLMERENASYEIKSGETNVRTFYAGGLFNLADHFRDDQNKEYLITHAKLIITSDDYTTGESSDADEVALCQCEFVAIPSDAVFRPQISAVKPKMTGPQTAIVVGKSGEEIWTDKYGRVKVLFHWDRYSEADEKSSCWIRVSQSWAGKGWGSMQIPRVGQEVLIDFLHGDPDQPIVIGSIFNGGAMPPYALPANATRSGVKSRSSKGGGGFNEIRLEDKKDSEQLFIHAQKDQDIRVENDQLTWVGNELHQHVVADSFNLVEKNKHETIKENDTKVVDKNAHYKVKGDFFTEVTKVFNATYTKDLKLSVGGDSNWKDTKNFNHKVGKNYSLDSGMDINVKSGKNVAIESASAGHVKAGMNLVLEAGMQVSIKAGSSFISIGPAGVDISGPMVKINSGGSAGSGSGSSPTAPTAPAKPDDPTEPKEADDDKSGDAAAAAKAKTAESKKLSLGSNEASDYVAPAASAAASSAGGAAASSAAQGAAASQQAQDEEEQEEEINCVIESLSVKCGHSGRAPLTGNTLEVVPTASKEKSTEMSLKLDGSSGLDADEQAGANMAGAYGDAVGGASDASKGIPKSKTLSSASYSKVTRFGGSEKITAELTIQEDCGTGKLKLSDHGDWKVGNSASFDIDAVPFPESSDLSTASGKSYELSSACEHHTGDSVTIVSYPSEQVTAKVSLGFISAKMDKFNKAWEDWGQKFMGIMPLDLKPRLIPPKGSLSYEKGWKENSDWRAYYQVTYKASLEPICGIEIEIIFSMAKLIGTAVGIPPPLNKFIGEHMADLLIQLGAGVELESTGSIENKYFSTGDTESSGSVTLGVKGKVWIGLTAKVGSQYIVSASMSGRCELSPYGGGTVTAEKEGLFVQFQLLLPPAQAIVKVEARAFVIFSRTKEKKWDMWKKVHKVESKKYKLVE